METAIKRAIEGGWKSTPIPEPYSPLLAMAYLDPNFWSALGKAEGWKMRCNCCEGEIGYYEDGLAYCHCEGRPCSKLEGSLYHGHRFWDHIMSGKDAESFFTALLTH